MTMRPRKFYHSKESTAISEVQPFRSFFSSHESFEKCERNERKGRQSESKTEIPSFTRFVSFFRTLVWFVRGNGETSELAGFWPQTIWDTLAWNHFWLWLQWSTNTNILKNYENKILLKRLTYITCAFTFVVKCTNMSNVHISIIIKNLYAIVIVYILQINRLKLIWNSPSGR